MIVLILFNRQDLRLSNNVIIIFEAFNSEE